MTTRLSAEERRALAMLATAGCKGATQPLLSGWGFDSVTITGLVHKGLATVTPSKARIGDKTIEVGRVRIKAAIGPKVASVGARSRRGGIVLQYKWSRGPIKARLRPTWAGANLSVLPCGSDAGHRREGGPQAASHLRSQTCSARGINTARMIATRRSAGTSPIK
jgi:hypothetical protein